MWPVWALMITLADGKEVQYAQYSTKEYCEYRALELKHVKVITRCVEGKSKNVN